MELSVIKLFRFVRVCLRAELANIVNWVGEASKFYKIKFLLLNFWLFYFNKKKSVKI